MLQVDVHAHLDSIKFDSDLAEVIANAEATGVKKIIANGMTPASNRKTLEIAERFKIVEPALGLYPMDALPDKSTELDEYTQSKFNIDEELEFIRKAKPIALGEVGMDLKWGKDEKAQEKVFQEFISLSEKLKIPLIIHSRKAESQIIDLLESSNAKAILHCFSGNFKLIRKAADLKLNFSIPCNIVRSQHFQKLVEEVNLSQLLTETDAPLLSPFPNLRNEPAFVFEALKKIAEIKKLTIDDCSKNIFMNYQRLF